MSVGHVVGSTYYVIRSCRLSLKVKFDNGAYFKIQLTNNQDTCSIVCILQCTVILSQNHVLLFVTINLPYNA